MVHKCGIFLHRKNSHDNEKLCWENKYKKKCKKGKKTIIVLVINDKTTCFFLWDQRAKHISRGSWTIKIVVGKFFTRFRPGFYPPFYRSTRNISPDFHFKINHRFDKITQSPVVPKAAAEKIICQSPQHLSALSVTSITGLFCCEILTAWSSWSKLPSKMGIIQIRTLPNKGIWPWSPEVVL